MKTSLLSLDQIRPYERNPRRNDAAVAAVAGSIREFGFQQPIVVDEKGIIIAGHTRYKAASQLGLQEVPVVVASDLTPAQIKAYRIADNKLGELAEWDLDLLAEELAELEAAHADLDLLGFDDAELTELLLGGVVDGITDPDAVPDPPDDPISQPGDVWLMGDHRLRCGDSADMTQLASLLDGADIHLVNTDPPYNVGVEPRSKPAIAAGNSSFRNSSQVKKKQGSKLRAKDRPLLNDFVTEAEFNNLLDRWFGNIASVLLPGRAFYIWGGYANVANYPPALQQHGLYFSQSIIWHKQHPVLTRKDFMGDHEWCFYGWREGAAHQFFGPHNASDVWSVKKVSPQRMVHLTEKPVELAVRAIQYSTRVGEHVLDLFGGSGSTLIAAEQTNRRAYLMELDPAYCDVIVERWEKFTGRKAQRVTQEAA